MTGFEIFDIGSWIDSDGLLMRSASRVKAISNSAARKLSHGVVASMAVGFSTATMASSPVVMRVPVTAQVATAPRAAAPIIGISQGITDAASPEYWAALMNKVRSWRPVVESSDASPEPLD